MSEEKQNSLGKKLRSLLKVSSDKTSVLLNRESKQIEFKETFNLGSKSNYGRIMASFANAEGGYIVFGVCASPKTLKGVNKTHFENVDPAEIATFLNQALSPEILFEMGLVEVGGVELGYVYTFPAAIKPVVAKQHHGGEIKEGEIYFRYAAQTTAIKYPELQRIIEDRLAKERNALLQHLQHIQAAGPTNVAVIDTLRGKIFGGGAPFLIDEGLARQLKVIREGSFSESEGATPVLKLIGELKSVSSVKTESYVPQAIHFDDLVTAVLTERDLDATNARLYFHEACFQESPYSPIFYFLHKAGMDRTNAIKEIEGLAEGKRATKRDLIERLSGKRLILPVPDKPKPRNEKPSVGTKQELLEKAALNMGPADRRSLYCSLFRHNPQILCDNIADLPESRILDAAMFLSKSELQANRTLIFEIFFKVFVSKFPQMDSQQRTLFRRALAYLDETLYS